VQVRPRAPIRTVSPAMVNFLAWEGGLTTALSAFSLAALPLRAAQAAAGELVSPLDVLYLLPIVAILLRGWWLLRRSESVESRFKGGLAPHERREVRRKGLTLLVLVLTIGVLLPADWIVANVVAGVLGLGYGVRVSVRARQAVTSVRRA
jgi:hypothetical protein